MASVRMTASPEREPPAAPTLRLGTRGSALAMAQARDVASRLERLLLDTRVELAVIKTSGDRMGLAALPTIGGRGVFVKEIEQALLAGEVDLAVHSLKDMPTEIAVGLVIAAVPPRAPAYDVLCSREAKSLDALPGGATVGTSSPRRRAQLLHWRADLRFADLRGNLETRLRKLTEEKFDAVVLAEAGLFRLGLQERITERLAYDICLPAPGQGALAVQTRADNREMRDLLRPLEDRASRAAVEAERALLAALGGGCLAPLGAVGVVSGEALTLHAALASPDGARLVRRQGAGPASEAAAVGESLAREILETGGGEILADLEKTSRP